MEGTTAKVSRRRILTGSGLGAVAIGLGCGLPEAADQRHPWTADETANVKLVEDFLTARWAVPLDLPRMGEYLADDCIRGTLDIRVRGRENILAEIGERYGNTAAADFTTVQTFARGPIVCNERIENLTMNGRTSRWHGIGVFRCEGGKIKEWRAFTMESGG